MTASFLPWAALIFPAAGSVLCLAVRGTRALLATTLVATLATAGVAFAAAMTVIVGHRPISTAGGWIYVDALSAFHLAVMAIVFVLSTVFAMVYFTTERHAGRFHAHMARRFGSLWLGAVASMTLVLLSNNLGIMWVGMETTTLLTAFLISLRRTQASLEAMWKYLIICSVGIAFAFLGTLLMAAAIRGDPIGDGGMLLLTRLAAPDVVLDPTLVKIAFVFLIIGYGTKAGIAPMHTWLPDAHSQAPAPVSAMFSAFMLNAGLYCIIRYIPLVDKAVGADFASTLLVFFGIVSIIIAAAFILTQRDAKRLLAYHSVEHLGIIMLGLGLGPLGAFAALFHTLNHALCKSLAFFAVGRLGQRYGSHDMATITGALRAEPVWGVGLVGALLALIGVAPFAVFMSEFQLLRAAMSAHAYIPMVLFLFGTGVVFVSALKHTVTMSLGAPRDDLAEPTAGGATSVGLVAVGLALLLVLGFWMPPLLVDAIDAAVTVITGGASL